MMAFILMMFVLVMLLDACDATPVQDTNSWRIYTLLHLTHLTTVIINFSRSARMFCDVVRIRCWDMCRIPTPWLPL
jgi:hypothetical protein